MNEKKGFRILIQGEEDDDEVQEIMYIRPVMNVEQEPEHNSPSNISHKQNTDKTKKNEWADLGVWEIVVDSAADESCWPVGQGDAYPTIASKRKLLLKTANEPALIGLRKGMAEVSGQLGGPRVILEPLPVCAAE